MFVWKKNLIGFFFFFKFFYSTCFNSSLFRLYVFCTPLRIDQCHLQAPLAGLRDHRDRRLGDDVLLIESLPLCIKERIYYCTSSGLALINVLDLTVFLIHNDLRYLNARHRSRCPSHVHRICTNRAMRLFRAWIKKIFSKNIHINKKLFLSREKEGILIDLKGKESYFYPRHFNSQNGHKFLIIVSFGTLNFLPRQISEYIFSVEAVNSRTLRKVCASTVEHFFPRIEKYISLKKKKFFFDIFHAISNLII